MNIVIDNDIWCELEVEGSICKYKFFLLNIPCYIGGHKKTGDQLDNYWENNWRKVPPEVIEGVIICDSNEDAEVCVASIERLIRSGYEINQGGWLIGMDMADVFMQFNGEPMSFLHESFENHYDDQGLMQIQKKIKNACHVFYVFLFPEDNVLTGSDEIDIAYDKVLPDVDAEIFWQISLPNECQRAVSVWYR